MGIITLLCALLASVGNVRTVDNPVNGRVFCARKHVIKHVFPTRRDECVTVTHKTRWYCVQRGKNAQWKRLDRVPWRCHKRRTTRNQLLSPAVRPRGSCRVGVTHCANTVKNSKSTCRRNHFIVENDSRWSVPTYIFNILYSPTRSSYTHTHPHTRVLYSYINICMCTHSLFERTWSVVT